MFVVLITALALVAASCGSADESVTEAEEVSEETTEEDESPSDDGAEAEAEAEAVDEGDDDDPDGRDGEGDGEGRDGNGDGNRGDRGGRSPQGINDGADERRAAAMNRPGRNEFTPTMVEGREVRSFDGTSNNEDNPEWGASFSHLQRLGDADYADGVSEPNGQDRLGAREISNIVSVQDDGVDIINEFGTTDWLWQWGQWIDHDLSITDGATEEEFNIEVEAGDIWFDPNGTGEIVMEVFRAVYDEETGTSVDNPREQENENTSWIDASMVYGSDDERAMAIRVGEDSPFLATSEGNLLPFNVDELTNANGFVTDPTTLFLGGDVRVNETVGLTVMHTLFVREHNRVAALLQDEFPDASGEQIFQSARRVVIAEIAKITFDEYLPALVGNSMPDYAGYDSSINPNIYNEFSAAAYRLGHSELSETTFRIDADGESLAEGPLSLRDSFFTGINLLLEEDDIDPYLRGLAAQEHQAIDRFVVNDVRNFLFGEPGQGGFDLVALNIQRGRDHGLPSLNATRVNLGLAPHASFEEVSDDPDTQAALAEAYDTVDDIDLFVGGIAESPLTENGSQLGETNTAIIVRQFDEVRAADRFWYENDLNDTEMAIAEQVTLANLIRNNTSIGDELQDNPFVVAE